MGKRKFKCARGLLLGKIYGERGNSWGRWCVMMEIQCKGGLRPPHLPPGPDRHLDEVRERVWELEGAAIVFDVETVS